MPICHTCRGEYAQGRCLCPQCLQQSKRGGNLCHHCGAETRGKRLCPRCKSDVVAWEQETFPLVEFLRRWGALGLFPSVGALAALFLFWEQREPSVHHALVSLMSIALSQLVVIVLYITRLAWRERRWASQVYNIPHPPMTVAIAGTFVGGIGMAIISFVLYKTWKPPVPFWQQLIFGAAYAPIYVLFTASLTLVAIQDYLSRLDQRVPPPLFVHTERLLHVAVEAALQSLSVLEKSGARQPAHSRPNRNYEVLEAIRIPENGGIHVLLRERRLGSQPGDSSKTGGQWIEKLWRIEADRWGRVKSVQPGRLKSG